MQTPEEARQFDELLKARPGSEPPPVPLARGWANDDYSVVRWRTASGTFDETSVPSQLAAFIAVLHAEPGHRLKGAVLAERVAKRLGISAKDYRPAQVFEYSVAKQLEKAAILGRKKVSKEWLFSLNPPAI